MTTTLGILSLILSIVSALYLQLPTFILLLGYGWSHNYPLKRWILRFLAITTLFLFINSDPQLWALLAIGIPFAFFWIFSLFNANPNLFIALNDHQIIKQIELIYPDDTEVVGYVDKNENAICYPVYEMVMPRHLLNDVFCENPLFISFCAACRSTIIYNPVVDEQRLTFEVLGVHRRNMIIRDIQTGTVWQQGTGEAMYGKLKGKQLEFYPYQQTTLADWIKQYPTTLIAKESDNIQKGFVPKDRLMKVLKKVTEKFIAPGKTDLAGLPAREKIWGLQLNGQNKAYPVSELKKVTEITDYLGGIEIKIKYDPSSNQIGGVATTTNERLKFQNHWWFGWKEFHPDTEIWKAQ
jgi:hypothetical protein